MNDILISYHRRDSFFHGLDPISKLVWAVCIVTISLLITQSVPQLALALLVIILARVGARIPFSTLSFFIRVFLLFSVGFFVLQLFVTEGNTLLFNLMGLPITLEALNHATNIAARMWVFIGVTVIFIDSTDPQDFAVSLTQKLKLHYIGAFLIFFVLNFMNLFQKDYEEMRSAYILRKGRKLGGFLQRLKEQQHYISFLIYKGLRTGLNLSLSLESRAFRAYKGRTFARKIIIPLRGKVLAAASVVAVAATIAYPLFTG